MKKIFLLLLLNVLFLSAFSQFSPGNTEIITTLNISKQISDDEIALRPFSPWGWNYLYYREVTTEPTPDGNFSMKCTGWGAQPCLPNFYYAPIRGVAADVVEKTCSNLIEGSYECMANGEYKGSISTKLAMPDNQSIILFTIHWDNDPQKPYNGKAEIIISKIEKLGF